MNLAFGVGMRNYIFLDKNGVLQQNELQNSTQKSDYQLNKLQTSPLVRTIKNSVEISKINSGRKPGVHT